MAKIRAVGGSLEVQLSFLERFGGLHGNIVIPLSAVRSVSIVDRPFGNLRGLRWPGTGIPGVVALGTWRYREGRDFVAIYGKQRAVQIDVVGSEFERLMIGTSDPESMAAHLNTSLEGREEFTRSSP